MKWIKLKYRKPSVKINGKKVLLYRLSTESQKENAISIFDTSMVRFCDEGETYWMALPEEPIT